MARDPLSPTSVSNAVAALLPQETDSGIYTAYEASAITAHACMSQLDFRLRGLDEDHNFENQDGNNKLPTEWRAHSSSNTFSFRYSHPQSAMQYMLKVSRLGKKALIHGVGLGHDRTASSEIVVDDYITEKPSFTQAQAKETPSDFRTKVFFSSSRLQAFIELFKSHIIQKLMPGLHKEGYQESSIPTESISQQGQSLPQVPRDPQPRNPHPEPAPARPYPFDDPLAVAPRRPQPVPDFAPPDFEDEHQLQAPGRFNPPYPNYPGRHPLSIGEDDLHPPGMGPNDPLRIGPGGFARPGGLGGGMHPSFGGLSGTGAEGEAPPGARWDPVGPGRGSGRGRGPGNPFGGFGGGDFI